MSGHEPKFPKTKRSLVFREEDDGAFIFDPIRDELRCTNESGALVFQWLDGKTSVEDIVKKLNALYPEPDADSMAKDVHAFIEDLKRRGFIEE